MSIASPYAQRNLPAESKEDCRDFLRTGRCKYGASCKYNHPANVQTGGGMKMPLDPTEPMFPIRPTEPICQYYMKHGTCKFGQACKFHHPPQSQLDSSTTANGASVAVGARKNDSSQVLWNGAGGDAGMQLLPQRPDEPNCIFYLKNGRCKYGSTCRYHHPLNYHERRPINDERHRHQGDQFQSSGENIPKVHYLSQLPPGSYQQVVVGDGTVAFLALDGSSTPGQVIQVHHGNPEALIYASSASRPLGQSRDVQASTSSPSIASSYETATSYMDMTHGDSSSSLWNRPRRTSSSNSLGAFNTQDGSRSTIIQGNRPVYVTNLGDSGIPLPRVSSISSNASENGSVYYDASQVMNRSGSHVQLAGGTTWRGRRANSFDYTGARAAYRIRDDEANDGPGHYRSYDGQRSPMALGRPPSGARRRQQQGEVDDGLSMMTSALLNMLDTPEEAAVDQFEGYYDEQSLHSSQMSTPQMRPLDFRNKDCDDSPNTPGDARLYRSSSQYPPAAGYYEQSNGIDDHVLSLMMPDPRSRPNGSFGSDNPQRRHQGDVDFLPWQGVGHVAGDMRDNPQALAVLQTSNSPDSPHAASNVGLYLP